jgi:hypothetical protein
MHSNDDLIKEWKETLNNYNNDNKLLDKVAIRKIIGVSCLFKP